MRRWHFFLLPFLCHLHLFHDVDCRNRKSKSVTTHLDAKWEVTPLVLEVAEYLADENVELYWSFIDAISNLKPPLTAIGESKSLILFIYKKK